MRLLPRRISSSRDSPVGLFLVLGLVVLSPTICLLWFMTQAVRNERLVARQELITAYRSRLALAQTRLDDFWRHTSSELDLQAEKKQPQVLFADLVESGMADSVVICDKSGSVVYPDTPQAPSAEALGPAWAAAQELEASKPEDAAAAFANLAEQATNSDLAARGLQSQARCLLRTGQKEAALGILLGPLAEPRFARARDEQGVLIAPNAAWLALELLPMTNTHERVDVVSERLHERLSDYASPMPASQRRFLMHEMAARFPDGVRFPTLPAEDLAVRYRETNPDSHAPPGLRKTSLQSVWQFSSDSSRVELLYETAGLIKTISRMVSNDAPVEATISVLAPGISPVSVLLAAPGGVALPDWQLALSLKEPGMLDSASNQRVAAYLWTGTLVVAAVFALALLVLRLVRRQAALSRLRNDLVANVTHELKTPLSSMRLLVETLLSSEKLNEQTAREYLQLIAAENLRLSRLIDNFLTFSRIERNKYAFSFKPIPASDVVNAAAAAVQDRFNAPNCALRVESPSGLPSFKADADALVAALVNLLDNAYKYSGEKKEITLSARSRNGSVVFTVQDNGIGIAPREIKRIFKRFYQVDQRLSRAGSGCGLGLSIVQFIVTAHHGSVEVASEPGKGSTFVITIPVSGQPDSSDSSDQSVIQPR